MKHNRPARPTNRGLQGLLTNRLARPSNQGLTTGLQGLEACKASKPSLQGFWQMSRFAKGLENDRLAVVRKGVRVFVGVV